MAKLVNNATILLVKDVVASAEYFRDKLGFKYDRFWGEPPAFCIATRDGQAVMLSQTDTPEKIQPNWKVVDKMWNIYFWVDDAAALYEEFQNSGATIDYELYETPYGCLEFGVQDLDGHDIAFGQDLETN